MNPTPDTAPECQCNTVHEDVVEAVRKRLPDEALLFDLADFFKVFGDSTRIRILWALSEAEMCVCDMAQLLGITESALSHQLRTLRQTKLVKYRKEGKNVFYSLDDEHIKQILEIGLEHNMEEI